MDKREIDTEILSSIKEYLAIVGEHYRIDAAYLFGSHARGDIHEWSDVDLAIVSKDVKDRIGDMARMFVFAKDIDALIEPHPFNTKDFYGNQYMMADEIIKNGIPIPLS